MTDRYEMCQNAAKRLQEEAYAMQSDNGRKKLKHFTPCEKGLVYTAECGSGNKRPQSLVTHDAAMEDCQCHRSLSLSDLITYELPKAMP